MSTFLFVKCSNPMPFSNLFPDATDKRSQNTQGLQVGSPVPDFTLYNTDGSVTTLAAILAVKPGVVLYFTMWCPTCQVHMDHIRLNIRPVYPNVEYYFIDYISGTIAQAYANQVANGYTDFKAAVDTGFRLTDLFYGTMSTTIVIDKNSVLRMNEDFKNGQRLSDVLSALP